MRKSGWTPSIVPNEDDQTIYLVMDCFKSGCVWRETDTESTDLETVIADLLAGEYNDPRRVIAFNTAERWSEDVSEDSRAAAALRSADAQHTIFSSGLH
jgi:hypothetical protein